MRNEQEMVEIGLCNLGMLLFCIEIDVKRNYYNINHLFLFFFYMDIIYLCSVQ